MFGQFRPTFGHGPLDIEQRFLQRAPATEGPTGPAESSSQEGRSQAELKPAVHF
jgi:hypothetical protein